MNSYRPQSFLCAILLILPACDRRPTVVSPPAVNGRAAESTAADLFEEIQLGAGAEFVYRNGEDADPAARSILEALGGGVGLLDFDGDGLLDVYFPGGGGFAGPGNTQIRGQSGMLLKNLGDWKFKDVTRQAGLDTLEKGAPWFYSHAVAVADYDRDGWTDLLVTGWGRCALFRNVPDGQGSRRFEDVSARAGLDHGISWATSAAWADCDGDGWPDLYVCQYVDWSFANHPSCIYDGKNPDLCTPKTFRGLPHRLYRNTGAGRFVDVSAAAGLCDGGSNASKGLGVLVVDVNLDGKPDIYVANDTTENFLYVNHSQVGAIRLSEQGMVTGVARDDTGAANGSMGLDAGDTYGTGRPALFVTNYEQERHALYKNGCTLDRAFFLYDSNGAGLARLSRDLVGWGTGFADFELRGSEDLFVVNGHVIRHHPNGAARSQRPVLLRGNAGKFEIVSERGGSYFRLLHTARGAALGDLDNDGKSDLVVSHINEPAAMLRNVATADNHWLGVELVGRAHADVVGARVLLTAAGRTQSRFAKGGGSYLSSPDRRLVFGLGRDERVGTLAVIWPDGSRQEWHGLAADRYHVLVQGEKEAHRIRKRN